MIGLKNQIRNMSISNLNSQIKSIKVIHNKVDKQILSFPVLKSFPFLENKSKQNQEGYYSILNNNLSLKNGAFYELARMHNVLDKNNHIVLYCECNSPGPSSCPGYVVKDFLLNPKLNHIYYKNSSKYISCIGSRDISEDLRFTISQLAIELSKSYRIYSGGSPGSDQAWVHGIKGDCYTHGASIFLPWFSFETGKHPNFATIYPSPSKRAYPLSLDDCPLYNSLDSNDSNTLNQQSQALLARDAHVLFGENLATLPETVLFSCEKKSSFIDERSHILNIAKSYNMPIVMIDQDTTLNEVNSLLSGV